MRGQRKNITVGEFYKDVLDPDNDQTKPSRDRIELINGAKVVSSLDTTAQDTINRIFDPLYTYIRAHKLGQLTTHTGFYRPRDEYNVRIPHIAFISYERTQPLLQKGLTPYMPDLAILVRTPEMPILDIAERGIYFLKNGASLVWIFHTDTATADVCTRSPRKSFRVYKVPRSGTLGGSDVLPGFSLDLCEIFGEDFTLAQP